jgi:DNA-binding transcriptional LysR family regulator
VSQQLTALESEVGARLVDRRGNRIRLTRLGVALVAQSERILVEVRAAEALLGSDSGEVSGLLRVGIPFREGPRIMSRALTGVRSRFPDLEIQLIATTDESGAGEVRRECLDMAILSRFGPRRHEALPGVREWVLGADPLRLTGIGWGVTVAPELTPATPESSVVRIPLQGVETTRQTVLVVRDGEAAAPRIAVAVDAVREVSRTWLNPRGRAES